MERKKKDEEWFAEQVRLGKIKRAENLPSEPLAWIAKETKAFRREIEAQRDNPDAINGVFRSSRQEKEVLNSLSIALTTSQLIGVVDLAIPHLSLAAADNLTVQRPSISRQWFLEKFLKAEHVAHGKWLHVLTQMAHAITVLDKWLQSSKAESKQSVVKLIEQAVPTLGVEQALLAWEAGAQVFRKKYLYPFTSNLKHLSEEQFDLIAGTLIALAIKVAQTIDRTTIVKCKPCNGFFRPKNRDDQKHCSPTCKNAYNNARRDKVKRNKQERWAYGHRKSNAKYNK